MVNVKDGAAGGSNGVAGGEGSSGVKAKSVPPSPQMKPTHELHNRTGSASLSLSLDTDDAVAEYVRRLGGSKVIRKVLIANNGIGAVKAIRSIRRWAYETFGNERQIQFVVMATPDDLKVNAEYIRLADEFVEVPGGTNNNNYANVSLIVDIAEQTSCDAVWAGWGHASENPRLPETLNNTKTKIAFMGPNPKAMQDLGDKIGSTILAQSAQVSCVGWSGDGITVDYKTNGIPEDVYRKACVTTVEEALASAEKVGYPIMIKASEGGGGKGIRKVTSADALPTAFRAVQGEVPGSPIFIMRLCASSRHLEVQLLADQHGNAIALYGRDCSVQRRHQKILEEGPVVAAPEHVWTEMEKAAVRLAKLVNYASAGTVEYLYDNGKYYFLELNPRLQVEHPVTEWITDVNLPAAQLNVAMGIRLDRIPAIRRLYGEDPYGEAAIDFDKKQRVGPKGHVIAARITAENPDEGFQPTSGQIQELNFRSTPNVWGYFSVSGRGGIHEYSDSQFGHLFAWGEDREFARKNLVCALKELSIHGEIRTPVEYLIKLLETKQYKANEINTQWLDGLISEKMTADKPETLLAVMCGALQRAFTMARARTAEVQAMLERGQMPPKQISLISFTIDLIYDDNKYNFVVTRCCPNTYKLTINKTSAQAEVRPLSDGGLLILLDGKSHVVYAKEEVGGLRLVIDGKTAIFPNEYDPTQLRSQMTGKLVRHLLEDGAHVKAGASYAEIEVMKMYMPLVAPESGRIHYHKVEGSVLEAGDLIAVLELDDPTKVRRATVWEGVLPALRKPRVTGDKVHQNMREALNAARMIMAGYENRPEVVQDLVACLRDPELPLFEYKEVLSVIASRVPAPLVQGVEKALAEYSAAVAEFRKAGPGAARPELNVAALKTLLDEIAGKLPGKAEKDAYAAQTKPLADLCAAYAGGSAGREVAVLSDLIREYNQTEHAFSVGKSDEDVLEEMREQNRSEMAKVVDRLMSHREVARKSKLVLAILEHIGSTNAIEHYVSALQDIAGFSGRSYSDVGLKARQLLMTHNMPTYIQRRQRLEETLRAAARSTEPAARRDSLLPLITSHDGTFDVLMPFFQHAESDIVEAAIEGYVRRAYVAYDISSLRPVFDSGIARVDFDFTFAGGAGSSSQPSTPTGNPEAAAARAAMGQGRAGRLGTVFDSSDNLLGLATKAPERRGCVVAVASLEELERDFPRIVEMYQRSLEGRHVHPQPVNILDVALLWEAGSQGSMPTEQFFVDTFARFLKNYDVPLRMAGIKLVTFIVAREAEYPGFYTFREKIGYAEDTVYRHVLPPLAYELELKRLANFNVIQYPNSNRQIHIYFAEEKQGGAGGRAEAADVDRRFFVRALVRQADIFTGSNETVVSIPDAERVFSEALKALEVAMCDARYKKTEQNHIFLNILPDIAIDVESLYHIMRRIYSRYSARLIKLRIATVELKINVRTSEASRTQLRFVASNPTGHVLRVDGYLEVKDPVTGMTTYSAIGESYSGQVQSLQPNAPYPVLTLIQRKRIAAHSVGTSYVYDFPELFEKSLQETWKSFAQQRLVKGYRRKRVPSKVVETVELVLDSDGRLVESSRGPGQNDVGMVAWRMRLWTPEYPEEGGREIIVIANDITFMSGSFGPREDELFARASELARKLGIPRIYLAANSGARINLANEVKACFQVEWNDPAAPQKGFKYLYLSQADYERLREKSVVCEPVQVHLEGGRTETRYRIVDIVGAEHGLGVENLSGSGMIAGETSRAYDEIFTLTFVTARTVGIGAYLVRLGQRVIQNRGPGPIILTGFSALNKVLGRDVYTSNLQIGGTKIMFANGVSHQTVTDDLSGVAAILTWLSYVPERQGAHLPIVESVDPINRLIQFTPTKTAYDPRHMLAGVTDAATGEWVSGFFDRGSWTETLGGWAKTVITGRARLGGIPLGVIVTETRTMELVTPADPANPGSQETVVQQAGQVWFPDSAYKTAQAIQDMSREGIPLIVFANWRGFSGGMRDMYDEILKFGSYIVDHLRQYKQPVFVYIPPGGELRGGAWVVIDSTINPEMVEMYADPDARGGVLEPQGIVEIKFRKRDLQAAMARLDPRIRELNAELKRDGGKDASGAPLTEQRKREIKALIEQREEELLPMYNQVAVQFADLHDTPGRMKAKKVIEQVVPWKQAREFFYWRLRRRLAEKAVRGQIEHARPGIQYGEVTGMLQKWLQQFDDVERGMNDALAMDDLGPRHASRDAAAAGSTWCDDQRVIQWLEEDEVNIARRIKSLRQIFIQEQATNLGREDAEATLAGLIAAARASDDPSRRETLAEALRSAAAALAPARAGAVGSSFRIQSMSGSMSTLSDAE